MKSRKPEKNRPPLTSAEVEALLVKAGIQPTAQRIAVCRFVLCEADHPTAEQVKAWADRNFPKLSLATVYNTLGTLVEHGLVREFRFPHSEKAIYDCNTSDHYHFVDEETGELVDLMPEQLSVIPKLGKDFQVKSVEVLLKGRRR